MGKQELLNLKIERNGATQEYLDKIAKAEGDKFWKYFSRHKYASGGFKTAKYIGQLRCPS